AGILAVGGTLNNSSGVLVTNTGTLAGGGTISVPVSIGSTNSLTSAHLRMGNSPLNVPGTLTVNNNLALGLGTEMDVKLGTATTVGAGVNDLLVVQGNLTINPNAYLNILPIQQLTAGTYVIATYTGSLTGQFTNAVGSLSGYSFSLDYSTAGQIKLNVTGSNAGLVWQGTNSLWDVQTTWNWKNGANRSTFNEGDAVTLDDTATNTTVQIATTLYPASITFNGTSNYSITGTGSGRISGGTGVTKNGTGTVLFPAGLGVGNDFTGPVNINNGIFKMNGALSLGATNGATYVASGATLDLNGQTPNDEPMFLQGTGFGGTNGAINNSGAAVNLSGGPRKITLQGDTTFNALSNRWDVGINTLGAGSGYLIGNGYKLTKIGPNDIWMHEVGDTGLGDILVSVGTLGFQFTIGMGDPSKTATVMPGARLGIWQAPTLTKQVVLTNGATLYSDGASNALSGTVTLYGTNTLQINQPLGILSPMAGTGGFHKTAGGTLYLPAANTYSGSTFVDAGSVVLGPSGSIANSGLIAVATNSVLDASQPAGGLNLSGGQTLSGSGSVNGNVSAGNGAQIAPGTPALASTLTFNNNLTLSGGTNVIKLNTDPSQIGNGVNDLVNVLGALSLSGVSTIQINPLGVLSTTSPYSVLQYGSGSPPSAANLRVVSSSPRYNVSLVDPTTTQPYLQVSLTGNPGTLVWKGGATSKPNTWDNSATNWLNLVTSLRDAYFGGDQAILDDTGTTNLINLTVAAVGTFSLSNNTKAYTITGSGNMVGTVDMEGTNSTRLAISNTPTFSTITANYGTLIYDLQGVGNWTNYTTFSDSGAGVGTIVKAGTNTMVMSAPDNTAFSGSLVVSNGVLQYTNALALGGGGGIYCTNTGSMDVNAIPSGQKVVYIAGDGFNGQGTIIDTSPTQIANEGVHNITLVTNASISAGSRWDVYGGTGGSLNGNGFKLTKLGAGVILVNAVGATGLGDIHVVAGRFGFQGYADMGDPSKTMTIESNAIVTLFDVSPNDSKNLVLNGNAVFDSAGNGGGNTFEGPVTLVGTNNLFGLRKDLHLEYPVSGVGGVVAGDSPVGAGTGTLYLDALNTYTGSTTVSNGHSIVVGASSSLGASSLIQVNANATLDISAPAAANGFFNFTAGQRLIGAGSVVAGASGNVVFGTGSTLAPGFPDNNTYTLTMSGNLTLQAGSTNLVVVNKTTSVANDMVSGLASVTMGGTLVVTNVGNALAGGDAIQLFSASSGGYSGLFANIIPATPGAGLSWDTSTLDTDGKLRVLSTLPRTPTNIVYSVSGNQLTLGWPNSYTGWTLQGQTNNPGTGITTNWHDVPGSTSVNQIIMPISGTNGSVFFRMILK
ncbi:MAG TPA: autotransporter-associated beta strand repeat-containing protein, partial [Candidatus Acidoferrum sp.]|nr:autotransporter-associated beta strand repeat-containing protein [Candidatus Acidoferrum sp.]